MRDKDRRDRDQSGTPEGCTRRRKGPRGDPPCLPQDRYSKDPWGKRQSERSSQGAEQEGAVRGSQGARRSIFLAVAGDSSTCCQESKQKQKHSHACIREVCDQAGKQHALWQRITAGSVVRWSSWHLTSKSCFPSWLLSLSSNSPLTHLENSRRWPKVRASAPTPGTPTEFPISGSGLTQPWLSEVNQWMDSLSLSLSARLPFPFK